MKTYKCACYQCMLIPICRNKSFTDLLKDCSLIFSALYYVSGGDGQRTRAYSKIITTVEANIKPNKWYVYIENDGFAYIHATKGGLL